jgi:hypothetical protein
MGSLCESDRLLSKKEFHRDSSIAELLETFEILNILKRLFLESSGFEATSLI